MITVYEDERTVAFLPDKALGPGHVRILPKEGHVSVDDIPSGMISHYFMVAGCVASALFDGLGAEGTNIIMNDGPVSPEGRWSIDVISRKQDDGKDFKWEAKRADDKSLDEAKKKIAWEFIPPEKRDAKEIVAAPERVSRVVDAGPAEKVVPKKEDYLLKFYQKIP